MRSSRRSSPATRCGRDGYGPGGHGIVWSADSYATGIAPPVAHGGQVPSALAGITPSNAAPETTGAAGIAGAATGAPTGAPLGAAIGAAGSCGCG
jgi:hypothetical protein